MSTLGLRAGRRSARALVLSAIAVLAVGGWQIAGGRSARPATTGEHCSALAVLADGYPVFGANMDYAYVENGLVFVIPRGLTRTGLWPGVTGENGTVWVIRDRGENWTVLKAGEREAVPQDEWVYRWTKMSKSKDNVVTPDEMADKYGADAGIPAGVRVHHRRDLMTVQKDLAEIPGVTLLTP